MSSLRVEVTPELKGSCESYIIYDGRGEYMTARRWGLAASDFGPWLLILLAGCYALGRADLARPISEDQATRMARTTLAAKYLAWFGQTNALSDWEVANVSLRPGEYFALVSPPGTNQLPEMRRSMWFSEAGEPLPLDR